MCCYEGIFETEKFYASHTSIGSWTDTGTCKFMHNEDCKLDVVFQAKL